MLRVLSAPAAFMLFVICGVFIGRGRSRALLALSIFLNSLNAILDVLLAKYFGMGIVGVAWGTFIAEYASVVFALVILVRSDFFSESSLGSKFQSVFDLAKISEMIALKRDIMLRTLFLINAFVWFTRIGASFGVNGQAKCDCTCG